MVDFWMFVGALGVIYLVPGPDMVLILETGALRGRRDALATVAGLALARAGHVVLAAIGLAALLRTAPWTFDLIRLAGAGYLIWLGIGIFRAGSLSAAGGTGTKVPGSIWRAMRRGLVTNISNPKALLFCSIFLPQFVHPATGDVPTQFAMLGALLVAIGMGFDLAFAGLGATLGAATRRHQWLARLQRWAFGSLMIGFGLRLLCAARPQ